MILLVWISDNSIEIAGAMQDADDPQAVLILEADEGVSQRSSVAQAGIGMDFQAAAPLRP